MTRYQAQHRCVAGVVDIFEHPDYENGSEARKKELKDRVGELMSEVSTARSVSLLITPLARHIDL